VYSCVRKTQATEAKRREEEILEQEQQNISASVEHAACFERPSAGALQVQEKLKYYCVSSWRTKIASNICVTLAIRKGSVFVSTLHLI